MGSMRDTGKILVRYPKSRSSGIRSKYT